MPSDARPPSDDLQNAMNAMDQCSALMKQTNVAADFQEFFNAVSTSFTDWKKLMQATLICESELEDRILCNLQIAVAEVRGPLQSWIDGVQGLDPEIGACVQKIDATLQAIERLAHVSLVEGEVERGKEYVVAETVAINCISTTGGSEERSHELPKGDTIEVVSIGGFTSRNGQPTDIPAKVMIKHDYLGLQISNEEARKVRLSGMAA